MRRILIAFYWLFGPKRDINFLEIIQFLLKPKLKIIGLRYIDSMEKSTQFLKVKFKTLSDELYWPVEYDEVGVFQVSAETFDYSDWHNYQSIFKVLPSDTVLDVGAAEGLFALCVIKKCKHVILVEPNSRFIEALKETFAPYYKLVELHEVAVSDKEGIITFSETSLSGSINSTQGRVVKVGTIDEIVAQRRIDFLKADIEGNELSMLKGAINTIMQNKPRIVVTTYHDANNADQIIALIKSYVPDYNYKKRGIFHKQGKPVTVHFWV
jgi:FkbM family methyltransferase